MTRRATSRASSLRRSGRLLQVRHEHPVNLLASRVVLGPKDRRRVIRGQHLRRPRALDELPALFQQPEARAEQSLRRRGPQADEDIGLDDLQLLEEPWTARLDLAARRRLVNAPLGRALELEMFDRVGDVNLLARMPDLRKGFVEHGASRSDEGLALQVLLISRNLADEDQLRPG